MASSRTSRLAFCMAVLAALVAVTVMGDKAGGGGGGGWQESVKNKAGEAADAAKSWKDWAFTKISEKWNGGPSEGPTDRLGETNQKVTTWTPAQKHGPTHL
ncbi:hypothetical protein V2J09_016293 [Rumex salicifolius]